MTKSTSTSSNARTVSSNSRRDFLKTGGALIVSFSILPTIAGPASTTGTAAVPVKTLALDQVDGFLSIDAKGHVTVYSGKVDLGTGVRTAMTQIAAEELCVPLKQVTVIEGDTALTPDQGPTFASVSIQVGGMQIRQAAATARESLIAQGAQRLSLAADLLVARDGMIVPRAGGTGVAYAALIGGKNFQLKLDPKAPLKDPKDYSIVGKSIRRLDIPDKVTGRFEYMQDVKVKGMLHARAVRPTAMKADLTAFDDSKCKAIPGYLRTVRQGNFLAVVARSEWAAIKASRVLGTTWTTWEGLPEQAKLWEHVRATKVAKNDELQKIGDSATAMQQAGLRKISATYDFAIHTHGSIGPSCAIAYLKDGKLTCWTASQATHLLQRQLAEMMKMKAEDVHCIYVEGAGCYGRNGHEDAAADAALLTREMGAPVRMQWMRADEHGWDPKGPPTLLDFQAAIDDKGNVVAWESQLFAPERPAKIAVTLVAAELADLPHEGAYPGSIQNGLALGYAVPNATATAHWLSSTPFKPSWIRTPGRMQNTFGNESFLDELAAIAGADPLEYRMRILKDPRGMTVLNRLAKLVNWQTRSARVQQSGDIVTGRGISYVKYELVRTYVGVVAEVETNRKTGKVVVKKFFVVHDCGQIINPDGLRNQIHGNVIQTVSRTMIEELKFNRSTVTSLDWQSYPILTFPEVPEIVIDLIDQPNEKPWGAGEPSASVIPSAIANAIYDALGVRMRSIPFTPEKVAAALI